MTPPVTVAFFGISGSGKGTQADLLERFLTDKGGGVGVARAEMGALLRDFFKTGTPLAKRAQAIVDRGGLLPSFMPIYMLAARLNPLFQGTEHLILDGVCRRPVQSDLVDELVRFYGLDNLHAIVLELSPEAARERLTTRGRVDDTSEEALQKRFAWYAEHVVPSIGALEKRGWNIHRINGGTDIQTIHKQILSDLGVAL